MPTHILSRYLLTKELKSLRLTRYRDGFLWEVEKVRQEFEICPKCASPTNTRAGRCVSKVRDEPVRNASVWLKIHKHRYYCKPCRKPFTESVGLVWPKRKTTERFRKVVAKDCNKMSDMKSVRRKYRVSTGFTYKVFYDHIETKLRERSGGFRWPEVLGIDEHFFTRQQGFSDFVTVFTDLKKRKLFEVARGKNVKGLVEQTKHIPGREKVRIVVIDMSRTYHSLIKKMFPNAKIVADKFHVLRLLTPSLIKTRREIHGHRQDLKTRRQLLRNRFKLDYFERSDIDRYLRQHPELEELYRFKEKLHELYRTKGINRATRVFEKFLSELEARSAEPLLKLARTLKRWKKEILGYFETGLTNAFTEHTNNRGKLVQKQAYGYKSFRNYRLRMLCACLYSGYAM
jgi:transposase